MASKWDQLGTARPKELGPGPEFDTALYEKSSDLNTWNWARPLYGSSEGVQPIHPSGSWLTLYGSSEGVQPIHPSGSWLTLYGSSEGVQPIHPSGSWLTLNGSSEGVQPIHP